jgi:hypothetical protein
MSKHQIGIGIRWSDNGIDARRVVQEALDLTRVGLEDQDREVREQITADVALVEPLLTRPEVEPYYIEVTDEEQAALKRILEDAQNYWVSCGYSGDENPDDAVLGLLAESGWVVAIAQAWGFPGKVVRS